MKLSLLLGLFLMCFAFTPAVKAEPAPRIITIAQPSASTQGQTGNREIAGLVLLLAGLGGLFVSSIYFIVRAFAVSATWGVFMLLFSGITIPLFCLFQFEHARRPLGIFLLSIGAFVGAFFLLGGVMPAH